MIYRIVVLYKTHNVRVGEQVSLRPEQFDDCEELGIPHLHLVMPRPVGDRCIHTQLRMGQVAKATLDGRGCPPRRGKHLSSASASPGHQGPCGYYTTTDCGSQTPDLGLSKPVPRSDMRMHTGVVGGVVVVRPTCSSGRSSEHGVLLYLHGVSPKKR